MSLGERLKNAREERGLTIDEIAALTYIRANHIGALERNEFHLLPPSRIRYFVRDYARVLNLDPDPFLAELPADLEAPPKVAPPPPVSPGRPEGAPSRPEKKGRSIGWGEKKGKVSGKPEREKESPQPIVRPAAAETKPGETRPPLSERIRRKAPRYSPIDQGNPMLARGLIGIALLLIVAVGIWYLFASGEEGEPEAVLVSDTAADSPIRIIGEEDSVVSDDTTAGEVIPVGDSLVLRGTFTQRAWYSISMDGEREDQGTLDSGEVREWRATESFSISLGNAGGVRFSINGKDVGTLGPRGGTVRGRVINAEGLQGGPTTTPSERRSRSTTQRRRTRTAPADNAPAVPELEPSEPRDGLE